jgi:hypothetical protein
MARAETNAARQPRGVGRWLRDAGAIVGVQKPAVEDNKNFTMMKRVACLAGFSRQNGRSVEASIRPMASVCGGRRSSTKDRPVSVATIADYGTPIRYHYSLRASAPWHITAFGLIFGLLGIRLVINGHPLADQRPWCGKRWRPHPSTSGDDGRDEDAK